jgi:hypothetical protein
MEQSAASEEQKQQEKEELFRLNKERVIFTKPTVKHIVSPHSGSILAETDPVIPLEEAFIKKCTEVFEKVAVGNAVTKDKIPDLLSKCGFAHDLQLLTKVVTEFYLGPESLELNSFLEFVEKFYAPDYYFGERMRKNVARGQNGAVTAYLVRNCDANTSDGEGTSSLHYCCEYNRPDIIEILAKIAKQKLVVNAQDRYGWSPLHSAAHQGTKNCVALLIKLGANVNIVNNVGKSPLHIATAQNRGAIADLLLNAKANLNLQDKQGMTPLHEAAYRGQVTLYNELSLHPTANMTVRDILGNTPAAYCDV